MRGLSQQPSIPEFAQLLLPRQIEPGGKPTGGKAAAASRKFTGKVPESFPLKTDEENPVPSEPSPVFTAPFPKPICQKTPVTLEGVWGGGTGAK